jgi:hypothetical protein
MFHTASAVELRERVRTTLRERAAARAAARTMRPPEPPPRYDDVFLEGQAWLDALAEEETCLLSHMRMLQEKLDLGLYGFERFWMQVAIAVLFSGLPANHVLFQDSLYP